MGPMARSVNDLDLLFSVLTQQQAGAAVDLKGVDVAWYTDDGIAPVTEETKQAVRAAAQALSDSGCRVVEKRPPQVERGYELWLQLFSRASVVQLRAVYQDHEHEAGSFVSWRLKTADKTPPPTLDQYIAAWMERDRLRDEVLNWLSKTPLIVTPVSATPAYDHDTLKVRVGDSTFGNFKAFSYSQTFNVFDLPVVTVPARSTAEGLPIGVQIIGRPSDEQRLISAAKIVEESLGGWRRPDLDRITG